MVPLFAVGMVSMMLATESPLIDLVKEGQVGFLATDYKGTPFGSVAPYALDDEGNPIVMISGLAVHTKNIKKKPESSVTISKTGKEVFNSQRATFLGKMTKVPDKEKEKVKKIFFAKFKDAEEISKFHDFDFYRMEIDKIYYIGGFGDINWVKVEDYRKDFKAARSK